MAAERLLDGWPSVAAGGSVVESARPPRRTGARPSARTPISCGVVCASARSRLVVGTCSGSWSRESSSGRRKGKKYIFIRNKNMYGADLIHFTADNAAVVDLSWLQPGASPRPGPPPPHRPPPPSWQNKLVKLVAPVPAGGPDRQIVSALIPQYCMVRESVRKRERDK